MNRPPLEPAYFAFPKGLLWAAHCSDGPLPSVTAEAVQRWLELERRPWDIHWPSILADVAATRASAAAVIGAEERDLTLVPSTSTALEQLAQAFPWEPGDEVLVPLDEFPSNAWPWKALAERGVAFREVPLWEGHRAARAGGGLPE